MRSRFERHLVPSARKLKEKPAELEWRDYLVMLLQVAAEIEHALMVEYLYAAYSLDEDQKSEKHANLVRGWRDAILKIAKEEMGHLLSVQNLLTLLGAPVCLDREDYPWSGPFYPFDFRIEPLSIRSLACYVFAEMPPDAASMVSGVERKRLRQEIPQITKLVREAFPGETPHHVAEIYETIIDLVGDREKIPDSAFLSGTITHQASWDDWGRGYKPKPKQLDAEGNLLPRTTPSERATQVIVRQFATRTDAIAVLRAVAGQGEAPQLSSNRKKETSHFERFLHIWREYDEHVIAKRGKTTRARRMLWQPARDVPVNPTTIETVRHDKEFQYIESERSRRWASLFNVRYRMLLTYLAHTFRLARTTSPTEPSVRAASMHRVFAEMYNLKTISGILVHLPFSDRRRTARGKGSRPKPAWAGPPFEMPYSLELPPTEAGCWRLHRELLGSSGDLCRRLLGDAPPPGGERYLKVLLDIDQQSMQWLDQLLSPAGTSAERDA